MYGKSFESQYSGSLVGAGLNVFAVWGYVITKTRRGVIELNPRLLAAILGGPEPEILSAIEFLCRPDPNSRSKLEDGRRMVKEGQFQYRVVNWQDYDAIKSEDALKEYNRRKQAEYRAKQKELAAMSPEERKAYNSARQKEYRKRRKKIEHNGAVEGATQAVDEGIDDAMRAMKNGNNAPGPDLQT